MYTVAELHFELQDEIGRGGEGVVYRAFDKQMNAILAVKVIPVASITNLDSFFDEARKLYLSRHHNIVPVQYACAKDNCVYMAMPYFKNGSVEDILKKRFMTVFEIIRYSLQFLSGLNNIHTKKLIHLDVKPANFLISDSDTALLSDFGVAQHVGAFGFAKVREVTEIYAPPEFFVQKSSHNLKFDIYQSGVSLYRMCNGPEMYLQQVINAATVRGKKDNQNYIDALTSGKFMKSPPFLPHIPKPLRTIVRKAMKPDPDDRFGSILDMLNALSRIQGTNHWQFNKNSDTDLLWSQGNSTVRARKTRTLWEVTALKNDRRKNDWCATGLNDAEKESFLTECFKDLW